MSRSAMGVLGGHGQGGLLVWESTETLPEGGAHTTSVTECAGRDETDAGGARPGTGGGRAREVSDTSGSSYGRYEAQNQRASIRLTNGSPARAVKPPRRRHPSSTS